MFHPATAAVGPDSSLGTILATLTVGAGYVNGMVVDSTNSEVYIDTTETGNASVISGTSLMATIPLSGSLGVGAIAYDGANGDLYSTANPWDVTVISGTSAVGGAHVGGWPSAIAYDSSDQVVYVTNMGSGNVSLISGMSASGSVGLPGVTSSPRNLVFDPTSSEIYVAESDCGTIPCNARGGNVSVVSGSSLLDTLYTGVGSHPWGLAFDPSNGNIYVGNYGSHNVSILSGTSFVGDVQVGSEPETLLYDPGNGYVYVANQNSNNVSVLSGTALIGTIPVGTTPNQMAYDPTSGYVYVANIGSSNLSVLSGTTLVGSIAVPSESGEIVYDAGNGDLYVTGPSCGPGGCSLAKVAVVAPSMAAGPVISSFTASPSPIQIGWTTYLNVSASGGTGSLSYGYAGLPPGCLSTNVASLSCQPTSSGTFSPRVYVNDTASNSATKTTSLTVNPTASGPTITSFTSSPSPIARGWTTYLNVSASGGTSPLTYAFAGLPAGCSTANVASLACKPTTTGAFTIRVYVNDSGSRSATSTATLTVNPSGSPPVISSFAATPSTLTLGASTTFAVSASGGTGTLAYTYTGLPAGCSTADSATLSCTPSSTGTFTVRAYVNDSASHSATSVTSLTVNPGFGVALASVSISPTVANASTEGTLAFSATATCTGGPCSAALTYSWTLSNTLGSVSPSAGSSTTFTAGSAAGTVTLTVRASLNGVSKTASATITISASPSAPPTFLGLPETEGYLLLIATAVAVVGALLTVVLLARRKRNRAEPAGQIPVVDSPQQYPAEFDPGYVPPGPPQYGSYPPR